MKLNELNNYEKTLIAEALSDGSLTLPGYEVDSQSDIMQQLEESNFKSADFELALRANIVQDAQVDNVIFCLQNNGITETTYNKIIELIRPYFGDIEEPAARLWNGWVITADSFKYLEDEDRESIQNFEIIERYQVPEYLKAKDLEEYFDLIEDVQADNYIDEDVMLEVIMKVIDNGWGYVPDSTYFRDNFCGVWEDFQSYVNELIDEMVLPELPECYQSYFDGAAWARDLAYDYTILELPSGNVAVFRD